MPVVYPASRAMRTMLARSKPCAATTRQATSAISSRRWEWSTIFGMVRCYRGLHRLCIGGPVRLEADIRRLETDVRRARSLPLVLEVDRAAGEQVDPSGHRESHQHGDVRASERSRHGPRVERRAEERDHDDEADQV